MVLAAQSQLEQEMQEQQAQGGLLHGEQMAEFSRLEAQANAKTSRTKTALDTLATTQQARTCSACTCAVSHASACCTPGLNCSSIILFRCGADVKH